MKLDDLDFVGLTNQELVEIQGGFALDLNADGGGAYLFDPDINLEVGARALEAGQPKLRFTLKFG